MASCFAFPKWEELLEEFNKKKEYSRNNLQKKPSKGILKTSRSIDTPDGNPSTSKRAKEQRFDETNIMETFHPPNKDYGHMKIEEPKTPYSEPVDGNLEPSDELDANILAAKLAASMNKPPKCMDTCEDDDEMEPEEVRRRKAEFEKKRKMHYNEFQALQLARQLMAQDEDDDDDDAHHKPTTRHSKT